MSYTRRLVRIVVFFLLASISVLFYFRITSSHQSNHATTSTSSPTASASSTPESVTSKTSSELSLPIDNFFVRITKKTFGQYITPLSSPISPERFTGYHTGVDVEYSNVSADVPVYAISDGQIMLARTASGYGGVAALKFSLNGTEHIAIYGHLRPSSLPTVGTQVTKGSKIAVLGTGYTAETDGERRHLHFAILAGSSINLAGYVVRKAELTAWLDPVAFFRAQGF